MGFFSKLFNKKENPDDLGFSFIGLGKYDQGDYSGAILDFTKAIALNSKNPKYYLMRGTAYEDLNNDMEAEKDFNRNIELEPTSFMSFYRLGMLYKRRGEMERSIRYLRMSFDAYPQEDISHHELGRKSIFYIDKKHVAGNLGSFLTQIERVEEGFKYLDEAIRLDPRYHIPYFSKGIALARMGKPREALPYIKKAKQLGNTDADAALKLISELPEETQDKGDPVINFVFKSSDHIRFENGIQVSGPHGGAPRAVKVEPNINGNEGYTVTMFNIDNGKLIVQMAPKQMKLVVADDEKMVLRGYGHDAMGEPFSDYGLSILHTSGVTQTVILHLLDREVDIQYLR